MTATHAVRRLLSIGVVWLFVAGVLWLQGVRPRTGTGWAILVFGGPPLYLAVEAIGEIVLQSRWLTALAPGKRFSVLRVTIGVGACLVLVAVVLVVKELLSGAAPEVAAPIAEFLSRHFDAV